ncbi:MAG: lysophospholipid acyltransferase family protein, partial [Planctomycetota bacterium]
MKSSQKGNRRSFLVWGQYLVFRAAVLAVRLLPTSWARGLGRLLVGRLGYHVLSRARRRGMQNLMERLGSTQDEAERTMRAVFFHLGELCVEFLLMPRFVKKDLERLIRFEDPQVLEELEQRRTGAVFVTGHLGNWELLGATTALYGLPLHSIARVLDNPLVGDFVIREREQFGQKIIDKRNSWSTLSGFLGEGKYLGYLVDQDARRRGAFVEFFGILASTTRAPALLAVQHGAPIVCGCAVREDGCFRIRLAEPIWPNRAAKDRQAEVRRLTQAYTKVLEGWVREFPEQWMW